jgi:hypothetical protein
MADIQDRRAAARHSPQNSREAPAARRHRG